MTHVVQGVGQQRDRPAHRHDDDLHDSREPHAHQADPRSADANAARLLSRLDRLGVVMTVRSQRMPDPPKPATTVTVGVGFIMLVTVVVRAVVTVVFAAGFFRVSLRALDDSATVMLEDGARLLLVAVMTVDSFLAHHTTVPAHTCIYAIPRMFRCTP